MSEQDFERLLTRALAVDVPEPAAPIRRTSRRPVVLRLTALAAGIVLAVAVTIDQLREAGYLSSGDLATDLVVHINHEPEALVPTRAAVTENAIEGVMRAAGVSMSPLEATMSYVKLCPFRGEMVAHFVIQGERGPVTVLLLPDEEVAGPVRVEEDGLRGTIAPLPIGGSIAVVGEPDENIAEIQNRVAEAVRWRL